MHTVEPVGYGHQQCLRRCIANDTRRERTIITATGPGVPCPVEVPPSRAKGGGTSLDWLAILAPKRGQTAGYSAAIRGGSHSSSAARSFGGDIGSPVASAIALATAAIGGTIGTSPTPRAPNGWRGFGTSIRIASVIGGLEQTGTRESRSRGSQAAVLVADVFPIERPANALRHTALLTHAIPSRAGPPNGWNVRARRRPDQLRALGVRRLLQIAPGTAPGSAG